MVTSPKLKQALAQCPLFSALEVGKVNRRLVCVGMVETP